MPVGNSERRTVLAMLLLVPVIGCSSSLAPRLPWSQRVVENPEAVAPATEQGGRIAVAKRSPFSLASMKLPALPSETLLTDEEQLSVPRVAQVSSDDWDLPSDSASSGESPVGEQETSQNSSTPGAAQTAVAQFSGVDSPGVDPQAPIRQTIDLASALGMAGGNAWTIQLARQRTVEAHADLTAAKAMWLPSLQLGVGWNKHEGRLQETVGNVLETSRGSFFAGGGATLGGPIAGGSNGPLRLFADLALAEAYFRPKIAGRQVYARRAGISVAKNKALLDAGLAYIDLLDASGQVADSQSAIEASGELLKLTKTFADAGAGAQADVDRAATENASLNQQLQNANRLVRTRSANLSRRLRLDPRFALYPADQFIVPLELSPAATELESLIATAHGGRPELRELSQEIAGLCLAVRKANIEPWIPHVGVTTGGGNFRGGIGSNLDNNGSRSDIDLQALWQIENLGYGVVAKRSRANSRLAQRRTELADMRDQITSDTVQAYENVLSYRQQIDSTTEVLALAESSFQRNLERVRADEGLPIELLQAIMAKANGLRARTEAVANYNRAQLRLLYATGQLQYQH